VSFGSSSATGRQLILGFYILFLKNLNNIFIFFQVKDHHARQDQDAQDAQGGAFRKAVAFVYFLFVWIFSISIIVLIIVQKNAKGQNEEGEAEAEAEAEAET
jgi:hypothetical protein